MSEIQEASKPSWWVDIEKIRTDYPRIQDLSQFLIKEVPLLPKYHPLYTKFWSQETKKCIEGIWGKEWGKYRYMPGNLYYFGNYTVIEDTQYIDGVPVTKYFKPRIVDYLWEFAYMSWTAYGFSGFTKDDKVSCHRAILRYKEGEITKEQLPKTCLTPSGEVKEYKDAFEYLSELKDAPLGKSLFENEARDVIVFGSRAGSKSVWVACGELEYNYVFGGARRYDKDFISGKLSCRQVAGSTDTTKSSELLDKFKKSQDAKIDNKNESYVKWFGIYTEKYVDIDGKTKEKVTPCPFYKKSSGTLDCPNKTNPYRALYKAEINGEWKMKGTGSELVHVNYSTKKGDGAQAAVGGRYLFSDTEEVGLVSNFTDILGANKSATRRSGVKFGVQWAQGTSGNIEFVQEAKKVFLNPDDYNMVSFPNKFDNTGKNKRIGYFIPNYIVHFSTKDANGNTDFPAVVDKINRDRAQAAKSGDPKVLRDHTMNEPCYIEEMWQTDRGYFFPIEEVETRIRQLTAFDNYLALEHPVKLIWDSTATRGVRHEPLHNAEPYREFPHDMAKRKDPSGCIVIYEFPKEIGGHIPPDLYMFIGHDPHGDGQDAGSSVATSYILLNPKYAGSPYNLNGNTIVASYIGKPKGGLAEYYENLEKLMAFYGNPPQGLFFEKNKGDSCREHFIKKHKIHLLAPSPQYVQGDDMFLKQVRSFGYFTGSANFGKANMAKLMHDWCLEETELSDGIKKNVERIPCLYLLRQMTQYNLKDNFDAVDGFRGCILALREYQTKLQSNTTNSQARSNSFKAILSNPRIFNKNARQRLSKT